MNRIAIICCDAVHQSGANRIEHQATQEERQVLELNRAAHLFSKYSDTIKISAITIAEEVNINNVLI